MILKINKWTAHHNQILYSLQYYADLNKINFQIEYDAHLPNPGMLFKVNNKTCFLDYSDEVKFLSDPIQYDYYFKRSLLPDLITDKIHPLNFQVNISYRPLKLIFKMPIQIFKSKKSIIEFARAIDYFGLITNDSHPSKDLKKFSNLSFKNQTGRIIFMTRLWDPARSKEPEEKERRIKQNFFRINACRIISKNFPNSITGIFPDTFAKEVAGDVLLDLKLTTKKNYLFELQRADIGIADDGLKDTPGWKIGEYIFMKKAIISTPIQTVVEEFDDGKNYISTDDRTNYKCLPDLISDLVKNKKYIELKRNNEAWFNKYMRPDKYIDNIINLTSNQFSIDS